ARITSSDGFVPDFVAKYSGKAGNWSYSVAGLIRQLAYDVTGTGDDETETGYGLHISGKYMIGQNDIRLSANYGSGTGRYMGLNTFNDVVINENGELEAIDTMGVTAAYRHVIDAKSRMNFVYSRG